ncbi:MAG TPA: Sec-independent protein translocase protein TatB [Cellvibrio sp.]|nr:Sec-independent protein translocase protein TatB [Cellvibrio sp.]
MFDIGFSELLVCAVVALVVIGPERMPEAVRSIGLWIGRFKRSMRETRQEIERQIGVEDIRRQLHNEEIMRSLEQTRADINSELNSVIEHVQSDIDAEERNKPRTYTQQELPDHAHLSEEEQSKTVELVEQTKLNFTADNNPQTSDSASKTP